MAERYCMMAFSLLLIMSKHQAIIHIRRSVWEDLTWHTVEHNTSAFNLWKYKMKSCTIYVQVYLYKTINCIYYCVLWHGYQLTTINVLKKEMHKIIQTILQLWLSLNPTGTFKQDYTTKKYFTLSFTDLHENALLFMVMDHSETTLRL